ncbi:peptidoglycan-binding protein [Ktedonobacter sp. SOSP1-85]|uniref:peptidoglycan-binding domain-containing protein n=1 Tax=Ktedonobacter sp. SOSP1-85 TaxID=2778367 RepID=UPI00191689EA|nr:peptidoglycan-binding domain-containing protein [Ktedonobacter sp. SOSP1-85]
MRKALKMVVCGALLLAALFSLSAFTSAPSAHAAALGMNPHTTPAGATAHVVSYASIPPDGPNCPRTVQKGDRGSAVKLAQQSVNWFYNHTNLRSLVRGKGILPIAEDGIFGQRTKDAIMAFQEWDYPAAGSVDGIVGPTTWHALYHC